MLLIEPDVDCGVPNIPWEAYTMRLPDLTSEANENRQGWIQSRDQQMKENFTQNALVPLC